MEFRMLIYIAVCLVLLTVIVLIVRKLYKMVLNDEKNIIKEQEKKSSNS